MVVILLLCKSNSLILKLRQNESSYLDEGGLSTGRFKVESVPGMRNREALVPSIYKPA